jgi:gas vesicle protein
VENNKSNNNFPGGFLFGVLIGAAIVFLLGTEKGKRILKTISKDRMDNLNNLLEKAGKATDLDEVYEEEPSFAKATEGQGSALIHTEENPQEKPKTRRFFKGISRHLN